MKLRITLILSALLACVACSQKRAFVGESWQKYASVEDAGFSQEKLELLTQYIDRVGETTGMVVIHGGKIVYEYGDLSEVSYLASVRKSVLAMLYGKYVDNGVIDLDTSLEQMDIDDNLGLLPLEKEATIEHLITARSGVYHPAANGGYDESFAAMRGQFKPGENFVYNNWDFNTAGYVLEKLSGQSIYQEIEQQLAIPLGFQDWHIENQKKYHKDSRSQYPAYHMYLSTRDMAKIGQLILQQGRWNEKQVISKQWIEKITTPVSSVEEVRTRYGQPGKYKPDFAYSYMWWNFNELESDSRYKDSLHASGWGGQFITIIPELDLVVAHKASLNFLKMWGLMDGGVSNPTYFKMLNMLTSAITDKT